jgi:hypothetical protein
MTAGRDLDRLDVCAQTGISAAVVVPADVPVAHTAQMFPVDGAGALVSSAELAAHLDAVMANLASVLAGVGAGDDCPPSTPLGQIELIA